MAKKSQAAVAVEDDDAVELEELDEDTTETASSNGKAPKADEGFGVRSLIALAKEKYGKEYSPREVRTLLRKLAREGGGVDREIVAGNKSRYVWTGADDPEVKAVLKAIKSGQIETAKKAALDKLKSDKAAKGAAKGETASTGKKGKAAAAAPPADDEDEDEDDD